MNATSAAYPSANRGEEADLAGVKTLQKALAILDAFAAAERPLTVAEVAVRASITRPTAHRLIQTLVGAGFLAQDPGDSRIVPGYSVLRLAAGLLDSNLIRLELLPHLENLARITGERVSLGILHRHQMLYLAGVEKPSLPTIYSRFGKTTPAYCSAIGKAILAFMPESELLPYLQREPLSRHTEATITSEAALRSELGDVRRRGFAVDRQEFAPGSASVGAPILVHGRPVAGVAVEGRLLDPLLAHAPTVQHTAEVISHVLGRGS